MAHLKITIYATHVETGRQGLEVAMEEFCAALHRSGYLVRDLVVEPDAPVPKAKRKPKAAPPPEPEPEPGPEPEHEPEPESE